jgi:hypothetical protein
MRAVVSTTRMASWDGSSVWFANVDRQCDAGGLEQRAKDAGCWRSYYDLPTVLVELDLLQAVVSRRIDASTSL